LSEAETKLVNAMYDSGVAFADAKVGELLAYVKALAPDRPTLIVLTSDHGEALGEDDRAGHSYLEDYNIMVPLIFEFPDALGAGRVINDQVRLIDLLPTVLDYLGLDTEHVPDGRSLLPLINGSGATHTTEAWTYSSSNNRGLSLRIDNRLKYSYNNTAWNEVAGEQKLIDLVTDQEESRDVSAGDNRTSQLRERVQQTIGATHSGYRLSIRNRSPGMLTGTLSGAWAGVSRIKTSSPGCLQLEWSDGASALFKASQSCEAELLFEGLRTSLAEITGAIDLSGSGTNVVFAESIDLHRLTEPLEISFDGVSWRRHDQPSGESKTGFRVWWQGVRPAFDLESSDLNSEILEQLNVLGYVE
jgi:hypothetical protein